jgi:hypothetical protein
MILIDLCTCFWGIYLFIYLFFEVYYIDFGRICVIGFMIMRDRGGILGGGGWWREGGR